MSKRDDLIKALEDAGIPDRIAIFGGVRGRIADMLVDILRTKKRTRPQIEDGVKRALDLAEEMIEEPPTPSNGGADTDGPH